MRRPKALGDALLYVYPGPVVWIEKMFALWEKTTR